MQETLGKILKDTKIAYKESIVIENTLIEEKLLSILGNTQLLLNQLEIKKKDEKLDKKTSDEIQLNEVNKVQRKVPLWLNKPNQYNYKILTSFMKLSENNSHAINTSLLEKHSGIDDSKKFISHYNQMKIISDRNHGKVFDEESGQVSLWKPVEEFIISQFDKR